MKKTASTDFSTLYRAAYAERDPQRKQMLLSQVQEVIASSDPSEPLPTIKLGVQSLSLPKIAAVA